MKLIGTKTLDNAAVQNINDQITSKAVSKGAGIRAMFAGGLSVKEISEATGIRYNHVYNVVNNEILTKGLQDEIERSVRDGSAKKDRILELLTDGKTIAEVSTELRCMYNYVWQIAKAAGLTKKQAAETAVAEVTVTKPQKMVKGA